MRDFNGQRVLIVRDAAIGDMIMVTPAVRWYAERNAKVYVAAKPELAHYVFAHNPHVTEIVSLRPQPSLTERRHEIERIAARIKAAQVYDAAFTCEGRFLHNSGSVAYHWSDEMRRANADGYSYYEYINHHALKAEGCDCTPELFLRYAEERKYIKMRARNLGKQFVLVQLQGSSLNKIYPWWPQVVQALHRDPSIIVITTGDAAGLILELQIVECGNIDRKRLWLTCGNTEWTLRDSLIATKYVDCVAGPETGILNASACFDTPKVPILSHSSIDNLCRGWRNCFPIQSPAPCSPCYRLINGRDQCTEAPDDMWPLPPPRPLLCQASIPPDLVVSRIQEALQCRSSEKNTFPSMSAPGAATESRCASTNTLAPAS